MPKSPAFQFYPSDFLSDATTLVMNAEEIGIYWLLICSCWLENGLPLEEEKLARLSRTQQKKFTRVWTAKISATFYLDEETKRYRHKRLDEEISKQLTWKEKSRQGGIKSAEIRAKGGSRVVEGSLENGSRVVQPKVNSSSSSSSSSSGREREEAHARAGEAPPEPETAPPAVRDLAAELSPVERALAEVCNFHPDLISPLDFSELKARASALEKARGFSPGILDDFSDYWESIGKKARIQPSYIVEHFGNFLVWRGSHGHSNGKH